MRRVHYMVTASGQDYALNGPTLGMPTLGDIAHHLAQINRFAGAPRRPESVAEHSLLCEEIAHGLGGGKRFRLCCLAHDWHEAYTHDISSPVKHAIKLMTDALSLFEERHAAHVRKHFVLDADFAIHASDVRRVDLIALATERRDLMPPQMAANLEWLVLREVEPWHPVDMMEPRRVARTWYEWRDALLEKYYELLALPE